LILGFLKEMRASAEPRTYFNLPLGLDRDPLAIPQEYLVVPLVRFPRIDLIRHVDGQDAVEMFINEAMVTFHADVAIIFDRLCSRPPASVQALIDSCSCEIPAHRVLESLSQLLVQGIVSLQSPADFA
jgi:hypothetical protein